MREFHNEFSKFFFFGQNAARRKKTELKIRENDVEFRVAWVPAVAFLFISFPIVENKFFERPKYT